SIHFCSGLHPFAERVTSGYQASKLDVRQERDPESHGFWNRQGHGFRPDKPADANRNADLHVSRIIERGASYSGFRRLLGRNNVLRITDWAQAIPQGNLARTNDEASAASVQTRA